METNKKNIPEIRFPEFMNDGEWLSAPLNELIKTIPPTNKLQTSEYKPSGKYPIIDQSQKYIVAYSDATETLTNTERSDTIVFGDHTCVLKFVNFPFIQGADGIKIFKSKDNNKILTGYLYQYLSAFPIESKEYKRHFSELKETLIKFPSDIREQKRIAECMESLERCNIQIKVKLEQLKAHKKGLMQKLFPAPGKSVPECRFKEFENDGEWIEFKAKFLFRRITQRNNCGCTNVLTISAQNGLVSQFDYFNKNVAAANLTNYYLLNRGDFAYNKSRSIGYPFGAIKQLKQYEIGIVSPIYICFTISDKNKYCSEYFEHYFECERIANKLGEISQEGARCHGMLNISADDFFDKVSIIIPKSVIEQNKIADCLSSIDDTIRLYANKLNILEQHKQTLRQRLFPTI